MAALYIADGTPRSLSLGARDPLKTCHTAKTMPIRLDLIRPKRKNTLVLAFFLATAALWFNTTFHGFSLNGDISYGGFLNYKPLPPHSDVFGHLKATNKTDNYAVLSDSYTDLSLIDYDRAHVKYIYPEVIDSLYENTDLESVDWSRYAYVLYATSEAHMCNAMMILAELRNYGTRAQLVMLVNEEFLNETQSPEEYKMLTKYQKDYNITLKPTELVKRGGDSVSIWMSSYTKLLVFNQTEYDRIIYMDSDAILLQGHVDELFFIPPVQMAVAPAYWHMHDRFAKEEIRTQFKPENYGFKPLTKAGRTRKIDKFINDTIIPFLDPDQHVPTIHSDQNDWETEQDYYTRRVNDKNFLRNVYNELPNYPAFNFFKLTNIMMVIQPSKELFDRVLWQLDHKGKDEYDMELVEKMFLLPTMLQKQQNDSFINKPDIPFDQRLDEDSPEILLLPYQRYATLSQQMNSKDTHFWWAADAHEQVFAHYRDLQPSQGLAYYEIDSDEHPYDTVFSQIKYWHFSDAPIPKPWWKQDRGAHYMVSRRRCESDPSFHTKGEKKPDHKTKDCHGGQHWEDVHALFRKTRWDVCGLDVLVSKDKDTYHGIIN